METKETIIIQRPAKAGDNIGVLLNLERGGGLYVPQFNYYYTEEYLIKEKWKPLHLDFINNEPFKLNDWVIEQTGLGYRSPHKITQEELDTPEHVKRCKKVIATTDKSLILYNESKFIKNSPTAFHLPQPSKAFIEKYCKVGGIDEVMVEFLVIKKNQNEMESSILNDDYNVVKEIILKVNSNNEITILPIKDNWTKEELIPLFSKLLHDAKEADYFNLPDFREKAKFEYNWINKNL